jgi:hypothetical protein
LLIRALGWPLSFPQFLAFTGAALLATAGAVFAFWAYSCYNLRYIMDRSGLMITWGQVKHFISIDRIEKLIPGRGEQQPQVQGLGWWGYHVGRGHVQDLGPVLFFSTHRVPEELVYIQTPEAVYALSPRDPVRFIADAQRFRQAARPQRRSGVDRDILSGHPIWADRIAQLLGAAAIGLNLALWAFIAALYPTLANEIAIEFPPVGDITTLQPKSEILKIPATATAILAINLAAGLVFQWRERAAAYLLLSGAIFFQVLFSIAAVFAVLNA